MKLEHYTPTFRNVLLLEVENETTEGGIFIPSSARTRVYSVVKAGPDCVQVKAGQGVLLMEGAHSQEIKMQLGEGGYVPPAATDEELTKNHEYSFRTVMEQQIIGIISK